MNCLKLSILIILAIFQRMNGLHFGSLIAFYKDDELFYREEVKKSGYSDDAIRDEVVLFGLIINF